MDLAEALDPSRSGGRLRERDSLERAEKLAELAMMPDRQALLQAQGRFARAGALEKENEAAIQQRLTARLAASPEAIDPADRLDQIATAALEAGAFNLGSQAAQRAAAIRASNARRYNSIASADERQAKAELAEIEFAEGLFRNVKSPEEWARANQMYRLLRNQRSPFEGLSYEPGLPERLTQSMVKAKDAIANRLREREMALREREEGQKTKLNNARISRLNAAEQAVRQRMELIRKNGGTASPEMQELRETQIKLNKLRLQANAGLSADNPHPALPAESDLVKGQYYTTPKGVLKWTGSSFVEPNAPMPATPGQWVGTAIGNVGRRSLGAIMGILDDDEEDEDE